MRFPVAAECLKSFIYLNSSIVFVRGVEPSCNTPVDAKTVTLVSLLRRNYVCFYLGH